MRLRLVVCVRGSREIRVAIVAARHGRPHDHMHIYARTQTNPFFLPYLGLGHEVEDAVQDELPEEQNDREGHAGLAGRPAHGPRHGGAAAGREEGRHDEERHHGQVLEEEDAEGGAAVAGAEGVLVAEELEDEGGGGEREGAADHDAGGPGDAEEAGDEEDGDGGDGELREAEPEYVAAHLEEPLHRELEPHLEEEEDDAQLG